MPRHVAHLLDGSRLAAELISIRLWLRSRLDREPLDALLERLSQGSRRSFPLHHDWLIEQSERVIARLPGVPDTCLYRALGRYAVLRRRGVAAEFFVGLPRAPSTEPGHAWILVDGHPWQDDPELVSRMTVTFRYPPAGEA